MSNHQSNDNIAIQLLQMDGKVLVDSRILAKGIDVEHESFMKTIYTYQSELERFGVIRFEIGKPPKGSVGGRPEKYAILNRNQAGVTTSLSRNTPQVVCFKVDLFEAIDKLERELALSQQEVEELTSKLFQAETVIAKLTRLQANLATLYDLSWPIGRHHRACDQIEEAVANLLKRNTQNNIDRLTYTMKTYLPEVRAMKKRLMKTNKTTEKHEISCIFIAR
jgi:phage regulator Rha-like protein